MKWPRRFYWFLLANVILVLLTFGLGRYSRSLALIGLALHGVTDLVASLGLFLAASLASIQGERFPYGLHKLEDLASLFLSLLITAAGLQLGVHTWTTANLRPTHLVGAVAGTLLLAGSQVALGLSKRATAGRSGSPALAADAAHTWLDGLGTAAVAVGLAAGWYGLNLDRPLSLLLAAVVVVGGLGLAGPALAGLLDLGLPPKVRREIEGYLRQDPRVGESVQVSGRRAGRFWLIEVELWPRALGLDEAADWAEAWKELLQERWPRLAQIHFHWRRPEEGPHLVAIPWLGDGLASKIGCALGFKIFDPASGHLRYWKNPVPEGPGRARQVATALFQQGVAEVWVADGSGQAVVLFLRELGVRVRGPTAAEMAALRRAEQRNQPPQSRRWRPSRGAVSWSGRWAKRTLVVEKRWNLRFKRHLGV